MPVVQERHDGPHRQPIPGRNQDDEAIDVPPGTSKVHGYKDNCNPFFQLKLPLGLSFEGKKSRCVSYQGASGTGIGVRGTNRTKKQAVDCVVAWGWSWWNSLSDDQRNTLRAHANKRANNASDDESGQASKKLKMG